MKAKIKELLIFTTVASMLVGSVMVINHYSRESVEALQCIENTTVIIDDKVTEKDVMNEIAMWSALLDIDYDKFYRIADCESLFDPYASNPESSAEGVMQILDGTWEHYNCTGQKLYYKDNVRCGALILAVSGDSAWRADPRSETCWDIN